MTDRLLPLSLYLLVVAADQTCRRRVDHPASYSVPSQAPSNERQEQLHTNGRHICFGGITLRPRTSSVVQRRGRRLTRRYIHRSLGVSVAVQGARRPDDESANQGSATDRRLYSVIKRLAIPITCIQPYDYHDKICHDR